MRPGPRPTPANVRFWRHVDRRGTCWLWTGRINKDGYGVFGVSGSQWALAHRYAWTLKHGPVPATKKILHRCQARNCVRHTYCGTNKDNTRDMMKAGRCRWDGAGTRKLSSKTKKALLTKIAHGASVHSLAKMFSLSVSTVRHYRQRAALGNFTSRR